MPIRQLTEADVPRLLAELEGADVVAVDTEFHAERRYLPSLYLVQLLVPGGSPWIIDPKVPALLEALRRPLLQTPWLVHGGHQDMRLLLHRLGGLPEQIWDTQIAAALCSTRFPAPFAELVNDWLQVDLPKRETLSDWSCRPLTDAQLTYAAADVLLLPPLMDALRQRLEAVGRSALLDQACLDARQQVLEPADPEESWRELAGAQVLDPSQASILQELAAWRERRARELDQPPRYLLPDGILLDLARRGPLTLESLSANRRISQTLLKKHGAELLDRIARAARRPTWAHPEPLGVAGPGRRRAHTLTAFIEADGAARDFAARLVLPSRLAEDLAAMALPDEDQAFRILGPWRGALIGELVLKVLAGAVALVVRDGEPTIVDFRG